MATFTGWMTSDIQVTGESRVHTQSAGEGAGLLPGRAGTEPSRKKTAVHLDGIVQGAENAGSLITPIGKIL